MRWPVSRATAKLLRRIRRKDMAIEKLKRRLTQLRRRIRKMKEGQDTRKERKAIIVITDDGDLRLDFVPRFKRGEDSLRGHLGFVGFMAVRRPLKQMEPNQ